MVSHASPVPDLSAIAGHFHAKRALEVAAAGGHPLALIGGPGCGKTLLARALRGLLPPYAQGQISRPLVDGQDAMTWVEEALRGHTGMLERARHGILLLDRLDCFSYSALQVQRVATVFDQAADIQLVLTLQPCPCGWYGDCTRDCWCSARLIQRFQQRTRALLERTAISVELAPLAYAHQIDPRASEKSSVVAARVHEADQRQQQRFIGEFTLRNAGMDHAQILRWCGLDASAQKLYQTAYQQLHLSSRVADMVLTVARTIADLAASDGIQANHLAEAIQYLPH